VDEADAQLGNRSSSGDSGVGNRVFAQIAQFMGNTELRGKVIWFLLTCRPDLLPVDLKRQGRAEEHIALFHPDTDEERLAMLRAMQKKTGTQVASPDVERFSNAPARACCPRNIATWTAARSSAAPTSSRRSRDCDDGGVPRRNSIRTRVWFHSDEGAPPVEEPAQESHQKPCRGGGTVRFDLTFLEQRQLLP